MKIYISVDLEGIAGVVNWNFTSNQGYDYARACKLMTAEVNAAIKGVVRAGGKDIMVNDSHNTMTNILIEDLIHPARLLTGSPKPNSMMEGLDDSFDGVLLLGYHTKMNTLGVLSHTYSSQTVYSLNINGQETGELGLNTYIAGHFHVPVLMVSGDNYLVQEAQELIAGVKGVAVKEARSRYSAICLNYEEAKKAIEETAFIAVTDKQGVKPVFVTQPVDLQVTFMTSGMADAAALMPGANRCAANRIRYTAPDILIAYRAFRTLTTLAESVMF